MLPMGCLDHHASARDPIGELLELGGLLADVGLDSCRRGHIAEAHLQGDLHILTKHPVCQRIRQP